MTLLTLDRVGSARPVRSSRLTALSERGSHVLLVVGLLVLAAGVVAVVCTAQPQADCGVRHA